MLDLHDLKIEARGKTIGEPDRARAPATTTGDTVVVVGSVVLLSTAGLFVAAKMMSDSSEIKRNIMAKQLYSATIPPGGATSGFLYSAVPPAGQMPLVYDMTVIVRKVPVPPGDPGWRHVVQF